jgi:flagellar basal-body rod protein FlgB
MSGIFYQIELLGSALNASEKSHRVVSQNIANVNTPGFKTKRVDFQEMLKRLHLEDPSSDASELPVETPDGLVERVDGNNVNLEKEISELKKNAMAYQAYTHLLASRLSTMRRAISG